LKAIIEQIDRLDRLVGQILTASGNDRANPTAVAMTDFLAETIEPYQDLARAKGLSLRVTGAVREARLDPGLTRRALENLITNAMQHTGRGGQITTAAKQEAQKTIIEVTDTGRGVASEIADTLFEPFVSGRDGGTGLGLAIAREAIESQGGHLRLVPSEAGAIFQIELPG
jgi:signal transduction histidine kinase